MRIYQGSMNTTFDSSKILAADKGMSIKIDKDGNETFDIVKYSPYFAGMNTLEVLTGKTGTEESLQAYIYSKGGLRNYSHYYEDQLYWILNTPTVLGLPVNVIEHEKPELSHIELRNSFMSHQMYQNWAILMEAELAVLKDIGYTNVELRDFFGKSYYLNNNGTLLEPTIFSTGYGAWDSDLKVYDGYSEIVNGIGLHIYSDNNFIKQTGNTLSKGRYTIGTRVDGVENNYTLDGSIIDVQGADSIGIAVAWGKGHNILIAKNSTDPLNIIPSEVIASGENGIGLSASLRWAIGKKSSGEISSKTPELKPTKISLNNKKL